ncbi:MAG: exonuclease domain-containing protein [Geminicoccaceae bacterium]
MKERGMLWGLFALLAVGLAAIGIGLWVLPPDDGGRLMLSASLFGLLVVAALVWTLLDHWVVGGAKRLSERCEAARSASDIALEGGSASPLLARLHHRISALAGSLEDERRQRLDLVGAETARSEQQRGQLEALLRDLNDGVICCAGDGTIQLYNQAARILLGDPTSLGLGRSIYGLFDRPPLEHALAILSLRHDATEKARFGEPALSIACSTTDGDRLLHCRLSLIETAERAISGFVVDFTDVSEKLADERRREEMADQLCQLIVGGEASGDRQPVEPIISLAQNLKPSRSHAARQAWPSHDVALANLLTLVERDLGDMRFEVDVGDARIHGDSLALRAVLQRYLEALDRKMAGPVRFTAETREHTVFLDIRWRSGDLPDDRLLKEPMAWGTGLVTVETVLNHHGISGFEHLDPSPEGAGVRLPLPSAIAKPEARQTLPPRPEFYDFDLQSDARDQTLENVRLSRATFVVFDGETTGLDPANDALVQLAGVRVVNGRMLTGETFDHLIDPGFPIPRASIRFHGITDDQVRGQPDAASIVASFLDFAEGAVLVAHNAAFDVAFLDKYQPGRVGDRPVLDTLLLSAVLHEHTDAHGLDDVAERFGVTRHERHQALGDSLTTGEILIAMIDLLLARGITNLGQALALQNQAYQARAMQRRQFGVKAAGR